VNTRSILGALSAIAATAIIAGCAGSQVNPSAAQPGSAIAPMVKNHCSAHGGVRVDPCTITFDVSNYGPDSVTVRTPKGKKGTLSEKDDCGGASGVATVTQGTGKEWTVTAGSTAGSCTAEFDFTNRHGKVVGSALLSITNNL